MLGDIHIAEVVNRIRNNPELWGSVAIVVTYDENGGFWDHVAPPIAPPPNARPDVLSGVGPRADFFGPGTRVPTLLVGPLAKKGKIDSTEFETGSILKLITERASHSSPGIRVMAVALHDIHPPQEVVGAYHEVTRAMEGRSQKILQARAQGLRRVGEQVARDLQVVAAAEVEKAERTGVATARQAAFALKVAARKGVEALTDFRLLWDAINLALAGRDKIVIDAENIRGRRNLWLLPQEWFKPLAPPSAASRANRNEPEGREP